MDTLDLFDFILMGLLACSVISIFLMCIQIHKLTEALKDMTTKFLILDARMTERKMIEYQEKKRGPGRPRKEEKL